MRLTKDDRHHLESAVARARRLLESDFTEVLEGRFGIHLSGRVEDDTALKLSASDRTARRELLGVLAHFQSLGVRPEEAARRLLREAVFTTLNRLWAIRVSEARGLLPESLARGKDSRGFREVLEVFPLLTKDAHGGYWTYLRLCADELARDAPVLFDPRNPLLVIEPSPATLDDLLDILTDEALAGVWGHAETLGWTYQYFVSREERRAAREEQAPRNSQELAVRNQWFTPRYVVDFLVHNTLGRTLMEAGYDLLEQLPMLVGHPAPGSRRLELEDVRVLDPAVGSGHFLLGCYDVLERAWEQVGVPPEKSASRILPCLWGVDIDSRCAQVAAAALILRARRRCRQEDLPRPSIVTARPLPGDERAWEGVLGEADGGLREVLSRIRDTLREAPVLGSLLKVEEVLRSAIYRVAGVPTGGLFTDEQVLAQYRDMEQRVLEALARIARESQASAAERLFAAEATDALRFVEAMQQRYDVVLMNPPFGEPIPETKDYLKAAYPWIPRKDYNLLAAFVGRGIELLREGGYLGAITSRTGLFLTTFEEWRKEVLLHHRLMILADLGYDVMEGAMVEASAYVVGAESRRKGEPATFLRLLKDADRPAALAEACRDARDVRPSSRIFRVAPEELEEIPGAPLAYWVAPTIRRLFSKLPPLEGNGAEVRVGLQTSDDFRFVRAFWEVDPGRIARSREETFRGKRWVPFAKGGEYSPYYADIHLVVDWEDDGRRIREFGEGRVQNTQYYFRPGLTWPERTNSAFAPQVLPPGCVFSVVGPGILPREDSPETILAWLMGPLIRWYVEASAPSAEETRRGGVPSRHYSVGIVKRLPWIGSLLSKSPHVRDQVAGLVRSILPLARDLSEEETSRSFVAPWVLRFGHGRLADRVSAALVAREDRSLQTLEAHSSVQRLLADLCGAGDVQELLWESVGSDPCTYRKDPIPPADEDEFRRLWQAPMREVIEAATTRRGAARWIKLNYFLADRRLETLSHTFERHPRTVAETRRRLGLLPPEEPRRSAEDLLSYLAGCALGRWDVRIGRDPSLAPPPPDPFEPVPISSPGMLVGPDGLPAREAPEGYPLELPPDRILLDEEGHRWDIVRRVRAAAEVLFDDADAILDECAKILGRGLRDYFRRDFFKAHLGRYSKSRRKAPIYWYLCVPSKRWGIWVYAPTLSRETLFAVVREARRKEEAVRSAVELLGRQTQKASGREAQRLARTLEDHEELLGELAEFRSEAERVAGLGWEPDLDDGIVLCAAPLSKLFPAWRERGRADTKNPGDPEQARRMLKEKKFTWATVSRWAEKL